MRVDRTLVALFGLGAVLAAAGSASASTPARPAARSSASKKRRARSSAPRGEVTLGPLTQVVTSPSGAVTRTTDLTSLTPAELAAWNEAETKAGRGNIVDLMTPEQIEALESASVETTRASMPGASAAQHERALRAAQRARELLGGKKTAGRGVARIPSNPSIDTSEHLQERGDDAPRAYLSPPTPINLELARREAGPLATHLRTKGIAGYSRQSLRAFQSHAGITIDGIYGPLTASALKYFGVQNPPKAFFKAGSGTVTIYAPAN